AIQLSDSHEVLLISDGGTLVRTRASEIAQVGRNTQGVTLIRLGEGESLQAIERVDASLEDEADADASADSAEAAAGTRAGRPASLPAAARSLRAGAAARTRPRTPGIRPGPRPAPRVPRRPRRRWRSAWSAFPCRRRWHPSPAPARG